jgi:predicted transcriptional regulator
LSRSGITIRQIKAARALLAWHQADLAKAARVSIVTIRRLEAVDGQLGGRPSTVQKIRTALARARIEFQDGGEPGVRLRKR